jgi:uncharacterized protein (TIGR01777 family)
MYSRSSFGTGIPVMPRHLLVSGASGLIGTPLIEHLQATGHRVTRLVRRPAGKNEVSWDPLGPGLDLSSLPRVDAVVNLAGENIATRWTSAARRRIHDSRVFGTQLLSRAIARLQPRPEVMVSASAIGIYGDRGDQELTETSPVGDPARDFLVSVCLGWEAAAEEARQAGIRVVHPRFGVVLGREGGALKKMLPAFRAGLGSRIGPGTQWMSWIGLDETVEIIDHILGDRGLGGPVNVTAPHPVRNAEFTSSLAGALGRPAPLVLPGAALRLIFGDMGQSTLLASARVLPARLQQVGYQFRFPNLPEALQHLVEQPR